MLLRLLFAARFLLFLPLAITISLPLPLARRLRLLLRALFLPRPSRPLLVLAHLLVHETQRLTLLLEAQFVVPAVRAPLPSFRIGLLTGGAKDAFRERHR
ncbi:MAG TPA: hypothetical protein VGQ36_23030 [Thermoanaerobaculia bacterium]|nr:hypothetical protein [Thermoanaerobaculia bacterium]